MQDSSINKISISTFKANRGFFIYKINQTFKIHQDGYENKTYENLDFKQALKMVEKILKKEFPRSHEIRYEATFEDNFSEDKFIRVK